MTGGRREEGQRRRRRWRKTDKSWRLKKENCIINRWKKGKLGLEKCIINAGKPFTADPTKENIKLQTMGSPGGGRPGGGAVAGAGNLSEEKSLENKLTFCWKFAEFPRGLLLPE